MQSLFPSLLLLACAVLFSSCSPAKQYYQPLTQRPSQPWEGSSSSWGGYTERSLGNDRVKVTFETFNNPGPEFASYFVKVRAAEIALARGHNSFRLTNNGTKRWTEQSHFPDYIVPGYWEVREREVLHCTRHCKKGCRSHIDIIRENYWIPERYVPPHTSVNLLSKAEVILSTQGSGTKGTRLSAAQVIANALSNHHGFGKPTLSAQTMKAYQGFIR